MLRYRLRTLLIMLTVGPPAVAAGYWLWEWSRPSPWYIRDGSPSIMLLPNKPGFRWKLTQQGLIEVPDFDQWYTNQVAEQ